MKKVIALFVLAMTLVAGTAFAACTAEEAKAKGEAVRAQIAEIAKTDAERAEKIKAQAGPKAQELKQAGDLDALCTFYDNVAAKIKK